MKISCLLVALMLSPLASQAVCKLPIPDGGGTTPSKPNIFGSIERVEPPYVFIRNGRTKLVEPVSISKIGEVFSVYGGDVPLSALKPGLQVWVWFEGCKRMPLGVPNAAYFQIFSSDLMDRAKLNREGHIDAGPRH
jgi:hypothetical protein